MSRLLLDEQPLLVMPNLACKIGLNEAMILQQIHYWNQINQKANNNYRDGNYWTFNSYEKWQLQFPFWSIKTIQRTIANLEKLKVVVTGNYNKLKIDRTKWYRIDKNVLELLETSSMGHIDLTNMTEWLNEVDSLTKPLPETNPKNNSEINLERYTILSDDDNVCFKIYKDAFTKKFNKVHMKISDSNKIIIDEWLNSLADAEITVGEYREVVEEYFDKLPKSNNGNILAFIKTSKRLFDVDIIDSAI